MDHLALVDPCDHCVNKIERQRTPPSELILFWRHVTRGNQGVSFSLASPGRVGENPGNKVGQEHF